MTVLSRLSMSVAIAAGLGLLAVGPASADTDRTDCMGNNCVHVHCYDDSGTCTRQTNFSGSERDVYGGETFSNTSYTAPVYTPQPRPQMKPLAYACDNDGDNCHWTHSYFYNDDGDPVFDPGASPY
jgi:hypothetical protein